MCVPQSALRDASTEGRQLLNERGETMKHKPLTRRDFLLGSATAGAGALLSACSTPTPEVVYQIVKETVLVEEVVKETVVVEQVVEKVIEVDRRRSEMTLGYTPLDQEGTFHHMTTGGQAAPTMIADFEKWFATWYPNMKYERSGFTWGEYWETLPVLLAAADHPDVAFMWFMRTAAYACKGWMHPIDDYIDVLPPPDWPEDYHMVAEDNMAYQGVQYGLARDWAPHAVLINLDIMEEAGMPYPVPDRWTWEEVLEYASAATRETPEGRQFGLFAWPEQPAYQWNRVRAWGGQFFNEDVTESRFDDPKTIDCFQWLWDAIFKHRIVPSQVDWSDYGSGWWMFAAGRIGMISTLSDEAKLFLERERVGDLFRLGIGPEPIGPSGQRFGFQGNVGWFIPSRSNWPDIAYELMRWRLTDDEQVLRFSVSSEFSFLPARKSAGRWTIVTVEEKLPEYGHAAWELGAENQEHFPLFPEVDEWMELYFKWIDPILVGRDPDVEGALMGLHEETNELFAQREPCAEPGTG